MVQVTYKKKGIRLTHIWFANADELQRLTKGKSHTDILFVHAGKYSHSSNSVMISKQDSLIKDLNCSEEDIWNSYGKHLKAYIKRSQREETVIRIFRGEEINAGLLDVCGDLYEQMKASKGIPDTFNRSLAEQYIKKDALVICVAYVNEIPVGFNAYIADDTHFRTWLTAFAFCEEECDAQVVSRAHQLLEWETMRYCCQNGITSYDFGGVANFEEPNGIDKFKMNFAKEGQRISYDNYLVGISLLGKVVIRGYKLIKKARK